MATSGKVVWVGWGLSILASLLFLFSAFIKFKGGPDMDQAMAHLGLPASMVLPLGILELTCDVIYQIPATSVLGAILLAGYIGGTIVTCWRSGDPFILNIVLGLVIWLGIYLREPRLKELIPLRRPTSA
jgi:hypothetical protein